MKDNRTDDTEHLFLNNKLSQGQRILIAGILIALGVFLQTIYSVIPFIMLTVFGSALLLYRSVDAGDTKTFKGYDGTKEWLKVQENELYKISDHIKKMKKWDRSFFDISNPLGLFIFIVFSFVIYLEIIIFERGKPSVFTLNLLVLFLPQFFTGRKSFVECVSVDAKAKFFLKKLSGMIDYKLQYHMLLDIARVPQDLKITIEVPKKHPEFINLYGQVTFNNVQGRAYPYFYCVLVTKKGLDLRQAAAKFPAANKIVQENKVLEDVNVLVIRQYTTRTSGYNVSKNTMKQIIENGVAIAEEVQKTEYEV